MEVKTLIVKHDQKLFEQRCKEYLEKGYKMHSSNIEIDRKIPYTNVDYMAELAKNPITFYFTAIFF